MAGRLVADLPEQASANDQAPHGSYAAFVATYNLAFAGALLGARVAGRALPSPGLGDIALFGVATHKLSRLLAKDKVTAPLRAPFAELDDKRGATEVDERPRGTGARRAVGELVTCPYCLDQWVAGGFAIGSIFAPGVTRLTASVLATVAVADFLQIGYKLGHRAL